ncbi:MAG: OmpH family outer membrane protein [Erythrobacter sp.]|jgi:Skp family chaperone for outer membrane proteins|nr:OmpH family outer membrane protein [Erythrobacter sp.]
MTPFSKSLAAVSLALGAALASPAAAQVNGRVATVDTSGAIIGTEALKTAYEQVNTTYQAQIDTAQAKRQELSNVLQPFDTNNNGNLDESELPAVQASTQLATIQRLEGEINGLTEQVADARIFAVEQILAQYAAALEEVADQQQIQMILPVGSVQFARREADITQAITTALNTKVPSVSVVPPQGYRRSQQGTAIFQDIQQRLIAARLRAAQEAQQGNPQAPAGR